MTVNPVVKDKTNRIQELAWANANLAFYRMFGVIFSQPAHVIIANQQRSPVPSSFVKTAKFIYNATKYK